MARLPWIAITAFAGQLVAGPVQACIASSPLDVDDIRYADVVVVGRIADYRIVYDEASRQRLLKIPNLSPKLRQLYEDRSKTILSDYAQFEVVVDEVLVGQVPARFWATWQNSTFGEPETMGTGPFLIALRQRESEIPPLRGPSATVLPDPQPGLLTVLQAPCSRAFILESSTSLARAVRNNLETSPR